MGDYPCDVLDRGQSEVAVHEESPSMSCPWIYAGIETHHHSAPYCVIMYTGAMRVELIAFCLVISMSVAYGGVLWEQFQQRA